MKILLRDSYELLSDKSVPQIMETLNGYVAPKKISNIFGSDKLFEGDFDSSGFSLSRIISYKNSFRPTAIGEFKKTPNGTKINVKIQIHRGIFFTVSTISILFIISIFRNLFYANYSSMIFPCFILIFIVAITLFGYNIEVPKLKNSLKRVLIE